jgi:DNA-directed RNA polymerase subunit M/transcription elongation factor TFIIS
MNKKITLKLKDKTDIKTNYGIIEQYRDKIIELLNTDTDLNKDLIIPLEQSLCDYAYNEYNDKNLSSKEYINLYKLKSMSIINNLCPKNHIKNTYLCDQLNNKEINITTVPYLTPQQLFPDNWTHYAELLNKKVLQLSNDIQYNCEFYTCSKCHKNKTYTYQKQLRSQDEGATTIVLCCTKGCKNKWHEN